MFPILQLLLIYTNEQFFIVFVAKLSSTKNANFISADKYTTVRIIPY